jgi:Flp pilus assembly protein protease CpaA
LRSRATKPSPCSSVEAKQKPFLFLFFLTSVTHTLFRDALVVFVILAAYFDLRSRRIPNALNYLFLAIPLLAAIAEGYNPYYYAFVLTAFIFALIIYALRAWAAGDAKYFTALAAWLALFKPPSRPDDFITIAFLFLLAALFFAPVALASRWRRLARERSAIAEIILKTAFGSAVAIAVWLAAGFALGFRLNYSELAFGFLVTFGVGFLLSTRSVLARVFTRRVRAAEAREGMVLAREVRLKGRVFGTGARGLTAGEARVLRRSRVRFLLVRDAFPFATALGAAALALYVI